MVEISIIIPSFNTKNLLIKCLESVGKSLQSTDYSLQSEIIVVDNGSTDGTVNEIKKLQASSPNLVFLENKQNLGFARAVNQGLEKAQGRYLLILNSDTVIENGAIDKEVNFLETHLEVGVVGCQLKNQDGSLQPSGGYLPNLARVFFWMSFLDDLPLLKKILQPYHVEDKDFYTHQRYLGWVTGAFFLTKREILEKVGFFDEKMFMYVEEVDWCTRVKKMGFKVAFDPLSSVFHLKGASSRRGQAGIMEEFQGLVYYFKKYHSSWQLPLLRLFLRLGALARVLIFGIIAKDYEARRVYGKLAKIT